MPKKHQPNYLTQYNHGSSTSTKPQTAQSPSKTVNERLEQLRREQSQRQSIEETNEIATLATQRTIPPHLRHILAMPESAPLRQRQTFRLTCRRFAGPPPPRSWMEASRHAPLGERVRARREFLRSQRAKQNDRIESSKLRQQPEGFNNIAMLPDNPHALPQPGSLFHYALKNLASNFDWLAQYEENNLPALPSGTKSSLLSYISLFGPPGGVDLASIRTLFLPDPESLSNSRSIKDVFQLDFTGLLSHELTLVELCKFLVTAPEPLPVESLLGSLTLDAAAEAQPLSTPLTDKRHSKNSSAGSLDLLPESWEDEDETTGDTLGSVLQLARFPNLTRLSLAHAGAYASWKHLLNLSAHLSKITHLSLAYWPTPSVTPNSKTAFVTTRHAEVSFGGSHLYSALDEDWYEAANILRRLSQNTYCLQWLDLEGCNEWLPALTWHGAQAPPDRWADRTFNRDRRAGTSTPGGSGTLAQGPDWNGSWSQVKDINVAQGFIPSDIAALRRLPSGLVACELLLFLRERHPDDPLAFPLVDKCDVLTWLEAEKQARRVAAELRLARSRAGGAFCRFDHGWSLSEAQKAGVGNWIPASANGST